MLVKELPLEFIGRSMENGKSIHGDLIHCGKKTYIKINDIPEMFDTKIDIWKNCIEVDPKSIVMITM